MTINSDVFLSYARPDQDIVRRFSKTLTRYGVTSWWDDGIGLSQEWEKAIYDNLSGARSVLVIWSKNSIGREWVNAEANEALAQGKLIQACLDKTPLIGVFAALQTAEISTWEDNTYPRGLRRIVNEIAQRAGKSPPLNEYEHIRGLRISSTKMGEFEHRKKHREGYFQKLDGPLYADFCEMLISGEIKLYDELRRGSRHNLSEDRYYEMVEYLSYDRD